MRFPSLLALLAVVVSLAAIAAPPLTGKHASAAPQTPSSDAFPNKSIVVYVADFDLGFFDIPGRKRLVPSARANASAAPVTPPTAPAPATGTSGGGAAAAGTSAAAANIAEAATPSPDNSAPARTDAAAAEAQKPDAAKIEDPDDAPRVRAAKLVELSATTLVKVLQQAGYTVRRLRSTAARPDQGVVLHGVFAQVDPNAGIRRMVLGGEVTDPKMLLFVGVGNLARPDQSLYRVVAPSPAANLGPTIAISAYSPASRYELSQDPSEDELTQLAARIAAEFTRVLNANPLAVSE